MKNSDKPINPCTIQGKQGWRETPTIPNIEEYGLTKREYFAGLALQGLLANAGFQIDKNTDVKVSTQYSICAKLYADELLKQLEL